MDLPEFLGTFVTVDELKSVLFVLGEPRSGMKEALISRVVEATRASSMDALVLLNNETLKNALRWKGLPLTGRKSDLVVRLVENDVLSVSYDDILAFLKRQDKDSFEAYHRLLLVGTTSPRVEGVAGLLSKATENHLRVFAKVFRACSDQEGAARTLVSALSEGPGYVPCFAACLLESMVETSGTVTTVAAAIDHMSDRIMARQRRIQRSFATHPRLAHPAVDSLLRKCWSGEHAEKTALLRGVQQQIRTETESLKTAVQAIRDPTQTEALQDVSRKTARIDSRTEDIHRGVQSLQDQLVAVRYAVQKHVEESPDQVARALEKLLGSREVKWTIRSRMKRDLRRFWRLTDRLQKIEFLGRAIMTYGPAVLSSLRGLL